MEKRKLFSDNPGLTTFRIITRRKKTKSISYHIYQPGYLLLIGLFTIGLCLKSTFGRNFFFPGDSLTIKVDSAATQILRETGIPSVSVAVVRSGKLELAKAYGKAKLNPDADANPDMRYAIGSISKQFTAASILLLEQDGKLSLEDPVSKWLPNLTRANDVTVQELLSHTSGYQDFWPQDYVPPMMFDSISPQEILNRWAKKPLDFEPGTKWQYSNTNFVIAALIVESIVKKSFYEFLYDNILKPLQLNSAVNFDRGKLEGTDPAGYMKFGLGPLRPAPQEGSGWMAGAGELAMTPADLAKWDISIINRSLLTPESYKKLETEVLLKNGAGTDYGLGVDITTMNNHRRISHGGEVSGFTAFNAVFPDDSAAVVVLTNQDASSAPANLGNKISKLLFKTEDAETDMRTRQARTIFTGLQKGEVDRSLFTEDANAYFSEQALEDFKSSLDTLGEVKEFVQTGQSERGGMLERSFNVVTKNLKLRVWTYQMPDGKLEQYQLMKQPSK